MSVESDVYGALTADPTLAAAIGTKVFPNNAPEGTAPPYAVYERRSSAPKTTIHDGEPFASNVSIAIAAWATTRAGAEALGDDVEIALRNVGIEVNRFGHQDPETELHAAVLDYEVWYL